MQLRRVGLLIAALLFAAVYLPAAPASRQILVVGGPATCPNAGFTKIQDAVTAAAPGAVIRICAGTYVEQVTINKPVDLEAESGAILMPSPVQANGSSLTDSAPLAAAILVSDATDVTIHGLVVDGTNSGISECSPILAGIVFQNSSGTISRVTVRNFRLTAANLSGCQSGLGIFVQSGGGALSTVTVEKSTVHDFQKNGITANEVGTQVTIRNNVVTGLGPTPGAAQNGIQLGFGAGGSISRNTVTNNVWSPCTGTSTCSTFATNILVTQSDNVQVTDNSAGINNVGIFIDGNQASVTGNDTFATFVLDGIHLEGNQSTIENNRVFNGAESAIFLSGNNNVIERNVITEAAIGILKATGSTGNIIRNNQFFGTPVEVQDPSLANLAKIVSPVR